VRFLVGGHGGRGFFLGVVWCNRSQLKEWFDFAQGGVSARQSGRSQRELSANMLPPTGGGFFSGACLGRVGMLRAADRAAGHRAHRDACSLAAVTLRADDGMLSRSHVGTSLAHVF